MMGVYIKGMEMPTSCARCPMLEGDRLDGLCHAASRWLDDDEYWTWYSYPEGDIDDSKPCNCPLVPVPPHGALIDRDDFLAECSELVNGYKAITDDFVVIPAEEAAQKDGGQNEAPSGPYDLLYEEGGYNSNGV